MADREKVIRGLECCMLSYKDGCDECPYIAKGMCQELLGEHAIALLKAQGPTKFEIKTSISNVDIPKDIDEEQFMVVLSQQYAALAKLYGEDIPTYSPS